MPEKKLTLRSLRLSNLSLSQNPRTEEIPATARACIYIIVRTNSELCPRKDLSEARPYSRGSPLQSYIYDELLM